MSLLSLLIRADAGGSLGTGHVMRMIALAQAWQARGGRVTLAACECPAALVERLRVEAIGYEALGPVAPGSAADLQRTVELARNLRAGWVAVDGYHFDEEYFKALKAEDFRVLAVDDYGHCETWHADLLLNQNLRDVGDTPPSHVGIAGARFLAGPQFALLRREFREGIGGQLPPAAARQRVLITFGGVDPTGGTLQVLQALNEIQDPPLDIKVLAGPANPNLEALRQESSRSPHPIELIAATDDMPALYQWSQRVISAGGSSCYEWMFCGVPGWVTAVAQNQEQIVRILLERRLAGGLATIASLGKSELADSLARWLRASLPRQAALVDGWGALRVAAAMSPVPCWVRPVDINRDARFLFDLANEPSVRTVGSHTQAIAWAEHVAWLQRHGASAHSRLIVIEMLDEGPVGQIRLHEQAGQIWEIGISIQPRHRQAGLASTAIGLAMREMTASADVAGWLARIRSANLASQRLFAKLGFVCEAATSGMQSWILRSATR